jgi:hypothetical protein
MNYTKFKKEVDELLDREDIGERYFPDYPKGDWYGTYCNIGGYSGGDCWGGEATPYITGETPEEIKSFDTILEHFAEDIKFMQYRKLYSTLIETDTYGDSYDYYGNRSNYTIKRFNLQSLYNKLVEMGCIEGE